MSEDPRRKLIAEAMEAHAASPSLTNVVEIPELHAHPTHYIESAEEPGGPWLVESFYGEVVRSIALSHNAIPAAAEIVEEQAKEIERLRKDHGRSLSIGKASHDELMRVRQMAFEAHDDRTNPSYAAECVVKRLVGDFREPAEYLRPQDRDCLRATIATQAKEIERLTRIDRVCVPVEHGGDSVSGDDFTGTHEEIRRWLYDHYNELWTRSEATIAEQAKEIERLRAYWTRDKAPDEVSK